MVDYNNIQQPFLDFITDMRNDLKRKIKKVSPSGSTYRSNTIATGTLFNSLRVRQETAPKKLRIIVEGSDYWQQADSGTPGGTLVSTSALEAWIKAKPAPGADAKELQNKIFAFGTNKQHSFFATKNIPKLEKKLNTIIPNAIFTAYNDRIEHQLDLF